MDYEKQRVEWLTFDLLEHYPYVVHGVFLRHGGTSKKHHFSLNLSEGVGDHPDCVKVNRETVKTALNLPTILYAHQAHGAEVHRVTADHEGKLPTADALFTTEKNLGLAITHADCQAAIFYDPVHEAVAVAHAGWKGLAQNIYARVVETLQRELGTKPHDLIVGVSPSLGPDHAEMKNYQQELPKDLWDFQVKPGHFDFWAVARKQLTGTGIPEKNIEITETCTYCDEKNYYSYRRDKDTGRHATIAALRE